MLKRTILATSCALLANIAIAQVKVDTAPTDFGLWANAELEKSLGKKWDLGFDVGLRTQDGLSSLNRWSIGVSVDFKPTKILAIGAGYTLIDSHYEPSYTTKGNINDEYWRLKNRFYIGAKVKGKWGIIRPSLRLRYQATHKSSVSIRKYDDDGITLKNNNTKSAETDNALRTKMALGFKTESRFTPYVSYELYNDLGNSFSLDKSRLEIGTDIKINKNNALGVGYVHTFYSDSNYDDTHNALSISYKINL